MAEARERLNPWLAALLLVLVVLRVLYHSNYLAEVPFALATFSDGRQYELAARDLLEHPPLGSQPFYLQGLYAYQMALPMALLAWVSLALLFQLLLAGLTHAWFFRAVARWRGRTEAAWATAALMSFPMLAFYENKFLTASLAVTASVGVLAAAIGVQTRPTAWRWALLGLAVGVAVLARPNFALLVPVLVFAGWRHSDDRMRHLAAFGLGLALALLPMAGRNAAVTGRATVFPAHGGGTSFYIGNNAHSRGVWNDAGGLHSGDVSRERQELRETLGVPSGTDAEEISAIGRALYAKGLSEIRDDPRRWVGLEFKKVWLMVGNDELTQDYDHFGEREMLWCAPSVGLLFGVGIAVRAVRHGARPGAPASWGGPAGSGAQYRRGQPLVLHVGPASTPVGRTLGGSHPRRRPLAAGCGRRPAHRAARAVRHRGGQLVLAADPQARAFGRALLQPRDRLVQRGAAQRGDRHLGPRPRAAARSPVIRILRVTALRERGHFKEAKADLEILDQQSDLPGWVRVQMEDERRRIHTWLVNPPKPGGS